MATANATVPPWRRRLNEAWVNTHMILGCIPAALVEVTEPPRARHMRLKYKGVERWDEIDATKQAHGRPALLVVHCRAWDPGSEDDYVDDSGTLRHNHHEGRWYDCQIAINASRVRIEFGSHTSAHLFNREHKGSGIIGVLIFALPVLFLTLPITLPIAKYRSWREQRDGMSRHARAILDALAPDLTLDDAALLECAFRNTWRHERTMARTVTFSEAAALLSQCQLHHMELSPDSLGGPSTSAVWHNTDGDVVARHMNNAHSSADHFTIRVLGSEFTATQARTLLTCYQTKTVRTIGDK
ncbi:hypothetical protein HY632_01155 [Candidatus Uhrbacteria bacterium]|nr:hypothetical protein [Candidatus Uhrbacteria bacterium]